MVTASRVGPIITSADPREVVRLRGVPAGAGAALRVHWPEYAIEAAGLGAFMLSACPFATLLEYPASPVRQALPDAFLRRVPMGSRWGSRRWP